MKYDIYVYIYICIYIYIYIHKYIDGWIDDWARAQVPKAQGPGAPFRALGQGPGAPYRALGPCALGTWAWARAQSSIHPSIHPSIYTFMCRWGMYEIIESTFLYGGGEIRNAGFCFPYLGIGI